MWTARAADWQAFALFETTVTELHRRKRACRHYAATPSYGMTVVAADFDEDGWPDIYSPATPPQPTFMNNHDGTFREEGVLRGAALSDDGMEQAAWAWESATTT